MSSRENISGARAQCCLVKDGGSGRLGLGQMKSACESAPHDSIFRIREHVTASV